jgi:hypothetical protein
LIENEVEESLNLVSNEEKKAVIGTNLQDKPERPNLWIGGINKRSMTKTKGTEDLFNESVAENF